MRGGALRLSWRKALMVSFVTLSLSQAFRRDGETLKVLQGIGFTGSQLKGQLGQSLTGSGIQTENPKTGNKVNLRVVLHL